MTVRMLLNHTSGLPAWGSGFMASLIEEPGRARQPLEAVKSAVDAPAGLRSGSKCGYTDVNYQLLQLLAERVTAQPAYGEIERRIVKPHDLSGIVPADRRTIPGLVPGYAGTTNCTSEM